MRDINFSSGDAGMEWHQFAPKAIDAMSSFQKHILELESTVAVMEERMKLMETEGCGRHMLLEDHLAQISKIVERLDKKNGVSFWDKVKSWLPTILIILGFVGGIYGMSVNVQVMDKSVGRLELNQGKMSDNQEKMYGEIRQNTMKLAVVETKIDRIENKQP